jgi:hypothetical protein
MFAGTSTLTSDLEMRVLQEGSPLVPPCVLPVWSVRERQQTVWLEGFTTLCMPAMFALSFLDLDDVPATGLCGRILAQLAEQFGQEKGLRVAQAAAIDAMRFVNAMYDTKLSQPSIQQGCIWSRRQVDEYHELCRCAVRP